MNIMRLHATCIAIGTEGVLLTGESGMGKSDLALRMIDRGAVLVADDCVEISRVKSSLVVTSPERIKGLLEIRGLGIFTMPVRKKITLSLVVALCAQEWIERLPYPEPCTFLGLDIPQIRQHAFEVSAPVKIEMALVARKGKNMQVGAFKE